MLMNSYAVLHRLILGHQIGLSFMLSTDWVTNWSWLENSMGIQLFMRKVVSFPYSVGFDCTPYVLEDNTKFDFLKSNDTFSNLRLIWIHVSLVNTNMNIVNHQLWIWIHVSLGIQSCIIFCSSVLAYLKTKKIKKYMTIKMSFWTILVKQ